MRRILTEAGLKFTGGARVNVRCGAGVVVVVVVVVDNRFRYDGVERFGAPNPGRRLPKRLRDGDSVVVDASAVLGIAVVVVVVVVVVVYRGRAELVGENCCEVDGRDTKAGAAVFVGIWGSGNFSIGCG